MTWKILMHSYRMLANNLSTVLRIALVPWLAANFLIILTNFAFFRYIILTPVFAAGGIIALLTALVWIAVGWHRYLLLNEAPYAYFPKWHGYRIFGYFWKTLVISVCIFLPIVILTIIAFYILEPVKLLAEKGPWTLTIAILAMLGFSTVISYVALRVSLILPAVAVGHSMSFGESWGVSGKISRALWGVSLALMLLSAIIGQLETMFSGNIAIGVLLLNVNGLFSLYSLTILTTLYGFLVEERELVPA